jgi:dihydrofolate reductase
MICSILAATNLGGIGNRGTLPWPKHREDLAWFREHTLNNVVVMGRKTWDDPLMPKPLPERINCVFSNNVLDTYHARRLSGDTIKEIQTLQNQFPNRKVFVIGGRELYEATESIIERVYLTRMKGAWFTDTRIDLERYLACFLIKTVRPGNNCTYEVWDRVLF